MSGSFTRKKFLVDFECMYWYVRSSRPTAWPDWNPQAIPSHLLLAVAGHGDGGRHPDVVEGGLVLREGQTEGRQQVLVFLDDRRGVGLADGLDLAQARQPEDVALPRAERRQAGRGVRGRENGVLVDVRPALVEVVGVPREDHPHLAGVLLQEVRSGADQALLEIAVLFEDLTREDHRDGLEEDGDLKKRL